MDKKSVKPPQSQKDFDKGYAALRQKHQEFDANDAELDHLDAEMGSFIRGLSDHIRQEKAESMKDNMAETLGLIPEALTATVVDLASMLADGTNSDIFYDADDFDDAIKAAMIDNFTDAATAAAEVIRDLTQIDLDMPADALREAIHTLKSRVEASYFVTLEVDDDYRPDTSDDPSV